VTDKQLFTQIALTSQDPCVVRAARYVPSEERLLSYQKIFHLGDPHVEALLHGPVVIQEKVDGSQFRWQKVDGELRFGSHHVNFGDAHPPDKLFMSAVAYLSGIADRIPEDIVFFGEVLEKPKHNTIAYERIPTNHIMLFDVFSTTTQSWLDPARVIRDCNLEIDGPRVLSEGRGEDYTLESIEKILASQSYLGGAVIEGVVVKNYSQPSADRFHQIGFCAGKMVRASFREENAQNWQGHGSIVDQISLRFKTTARFEKAYIHARDAGEIESSMRDMVPLLRWMDLDIEEEVKEAAMEMFWADSKREIEKRLKSGMAEWLKAKLLEKQFENQGIQPSPVIQSMIDGLKTAAKEGGSDL
jgi:hypothetical protein